ncbi:MAG TPA: hypothetical protein P5132_02350 [Bacteroidales bacterium]|nr:hypothetical protein [Bacteroidales bacterium]
MKKLLFLTYIIISFPFALFSQDQDSDFPKIFYRNEKTLGINLFTNGWGLGYRYGDRVNYFEKKLYEVDLSLIKHSKEVKSTSSFITSESIIFGKLNYAFDLRAGYGKQNEIYSKRSPGSVAVRSFYSFGPSVAILKPIYYKILYPLNDSVYGVREEKFNPDIHTSGDISGKASFFKGFDELKFIPGAYIKLGVNFEFSQSEFLIHAIEAGAMFTAYLKNLDIMAVDDNQQYFLVLFASYRFGKVTNAQELSPEYLKKQKRKIRLLKRNR